MTFPPPPDRFKGTWPDPVAIGGTLYIHFGDATKAGQTVSVNIVDTGIGQLVTVEIVLDDTGNGEIAWPVPMDWGPFATLEGPNSTDHTIDVTGSARPIGSPS